MFQNTYNHNIRSKEHQKNHKNLTIRGRGVNAYRQPDRKLSVFFTPRSSMFTLLTLQLFNNTVFTIQTTGCLKKTEFCQIEHLQILLVIGEKYLMIFVANPVVSCFESAISMFLLGALQIQPSGHTGFGKGHLRTRGSTKTYGFST